MNETGIDLTDFITIDAKEIRVPNEFPKVHNDSSRIAVIGEAPGRDEVEWQRCICGNEFSRYYYDSQIRQYITVSQCPQCQSTDFHSSPRPFVGASGRFLTSLLIESNIDRREVFLGNICQYRPPNNDIKKFSWADPRITEGLDSLRIEINRFNPHLCVLLGGTALRAAKGTWFNDKGKEKTYSLSDWRGSLFICDQPNSPFYERKCIATYHPAYLFRVYGDTPLVRFDLRRARKHSTTAILPEPRLVLDVDPHHGTIIARLRAIKKNKIPISVDIEGGCGTMSCMSISPTESEAFIIPFSTPQGGNFWNESEEVELWEALASVMEDPEIPKKLQNAMYDRFVCAHSYKMLFRHIGDDTMLKHWELFCELEKSLAVQTSIYTEVPYYKDERFAGNQRTFWSYCCKDSAITNSINTTQDKMLQGRSRNHYEFNKRLLDPFLYIELKGLLVDTNKRDQRIEQLKAQAHFVAKGKKKQSSGTEQKKLEEMVGWQINVNSRVDMLKFLYEQMKLPMQTKDRGDGVHTPTADYETLLTFYHQTRHPVLKQCISVRQIRKRCSDLAGMTTDPDGRIRTSINIVGSNTGRTSSSVAPTGEGTNLHTVPDQDKDIFIADPGHEYGQFDLAGADGWTVAAHCARLGDPTMLEDYLAGLKPAKLVALAHLHGEKINSLDRATLKLMSKSINAETDKTNNYLYFACKRIQHGTNYLMGPKKLALQIFLDTEGAAFITTDQAKQIQNLYLLRYPGIRRWQDWVRGELQKSGTLTAASGHRRIFYGRKTDQDTVGQGCAYEPQHNTTYATNLALLKLWDDPDNRIYQKSGGALLRVWPCHHIHDALNVQWQVFEREFAISKVREWFNNPFMIGGIPITIPYEGFYGSSWGDKAHEI